MEITRPERAVILALIGLLVAGSGFLFYRWSRGYPAAVEAPTGSVGRLPGQVIRDGTTGPEGGVRGLPPGGQTIVDKERPKIWVHVAGKVAHPGVYQLEKGSRVQEAILAAGGQAEGGRADLLNLAAPLTDGEKVYVPSQVEVRAAEGSGIPPTWPAGIGSGLAPKIKINPNLASQEALEALPGVGPAMAQRIIQHRQSQGPFRRLEDLKKIPGIGDRKYEELKAYLVLP